MLRLIVILAAVTAGATHSLGAEIDDVRGSTQGLLNDAPQWSAGVQIGSYGATGIAAQRLGIMDGAINTNVGLAYGGLLLSADYVLLYDGNFQRRLIGDQATYNDQRGVVMPYFGAGLMIGEAVAMRLPFGMQYAMERDPFNFNIGAALVVGRFNNKHSDKDVNARIWIHAGASVML